MSNLLNQTGERILTTFMELMQKNGIAGTTTRLLAKTASVNEVTIFRHFGDKQNLIRQAFHYHNPANQIQSYQPKFDAHSPTTSARAILDTMLFLRTGLIEHPEFWQYSLAEYNHFPELRTEFEAAPKAAKALLEKVIRQASPVLKPGVIPEQAAINLLASVFTTVLWQSRQWLNFNEAEWQQTFLLAIGGIIEFSPSEVLEREQD